MIINHLLLMINKYLSFFSRKKILGKKIRLQIKITLEFPEDHFSGKKFSGKKSGYKENEPGDKDHGAGRERGSAC
ncbi:MAG: hypothetical protein ACTSYF_17390 [Promethearchaeota archaeon]